MELKAHGPLCCSRKEIEKRRIRRRGVTVTMAQLGSLNFRYETWFQPGADLCTGWPRFICHRFFLSFLFQYCQIPLSAKWDFMRHNTSGWHSGGKKRRKGCSDEEGKDAGEPMSDLAEARGTGGKLSDLHRLVVIGVILVIRIDVVITIRTGWRGREWERRWDIRAVSSM